ncbi:ATP-binding protein [Streptomyces sp. NPDC045431]|uniref:wHTH domain-containing protein n=1 Tax=Streptomyces sp. NPDC045431 TaxID=3155613 RepID=UPI0033FCF574
MQDAGSRNGGNSRNVVGDSTVVGSVVQAQNIGQLTIHQAPVPLVPSGAEDPWVSAVRGSAVWKHVPDSRDAGPHREAAAAMAGALARLRDAAEARLADDPWQDPHSALRFAERVEWLLGEEPGLDLHPAEAALFALVPLLSRVHDLRMAADRLDVEPWLLGVPVQAPERASFEAYADGHRLLVQRALLRPEAEAPIGWWLYHRWLVRHESHAHEETVRELLDALGTPDAPLHRVVTPRRVSRLLHALRRGPDVCNPEFLDALPSEESLGVQRVRDQRLALLCSLAYALTAEVTTLPDIVAEHLGIPHPVGLAALCTTLEESSWGGPADLPVLRAECAHEAVVEGLRTAVARMDETLHAVTRTVRERITHPMPRLPVRLSADGVVPADGTFTGWASFRLDERRVRELLMGVQLYKDPDLAVRELYQNALDACRYRRARTEYLDRTHAGATYAYEGSIVFEQSVDDDGRAYVECRDNGIGMGEAELRGVFSRAGARFAEQPEFGEERAEWARLDPPVELYPNSRFGIGVLSYFMLADELRVTTCRLGRDGRPGPVLEASIFGPGHLFRIVRRAERGTEPGTTVRLYLREAGDSDWSCPGVLDRLLGVAEFPTVARHGVDVVTWEPGRLHERRWPRNEEFGLHVSGAIDAWPDAPAGVQVFWCRSGGGLLVDGLVVRPAVTGGLVSARGGELPGAVVNLSGPFAPERLTADRSQILDDLREPLRRLMVDAAAHLLDSPLLDYRWLTWLAEDNEVLADLVVEHCIAEDRAIAVPEMTFCDARTGYFIEDLPFLFPELKDVYDARRWRTTTRLTMPDHILLWRLLAHRPHPVLNELIRLCPELDAIGPVAPALPSDARLLRQWSHHHRAVWEFAQTLGRSPRAVVLRAAHLGLFDGSWEAFPSELPPAGTGTTRAAFRRPARPRPGVSLLIRTAQQERASLGSIVDRWRNAGVDVPDAMVHTAEAAAADDLLAPYLRQSESAHWFKPGAHVEPGRLVMLANALSVTVPDLCARLRACGLIVDGTGLPDRPGPELARLLSSLLTGASPWLAVGDPVSPAHVLEAAKARGMAPAEVLTWYESLGFAAPEGFPAEVEPHDLDLLTPPQGYGPTQAPLRPGRAVDYSHLLSGARGAGVSPAEAASRLHAFGLLVPKLRSVVPSDLDHQLLAEDGPLPWGGLRAVEPVPFARILIASRRLGIHPREIAGRLAEHGITSSCQDLPDGLSYDMAFLLIDEWEKRGRAGAVPLQVLMEKAREVREPIARVHHWLVQLGIPVTDPAEAVGAALPRIPLISRTPAD